MGANIFLHEFRTRLRSVLVWSVSIAAVVLFFMSIYQSFAAEAEVTKTLLAKFPPALLEAFGLNRMDLATVTGFFGFMVVFIQLMLAIQAGNYGFGLVSVEENEMTADFLLTKPVSRFQVLTSKLLAVLCSLLLTELIIWAVSYISISLFRAGRPYDAGVVALLLASLVIFQLFFLCVGLVVSLLVRRVRSVTPYSLGLGFGAYVLAAFSGVFGDIKLEYITPFKHFDPPYIVSHVGYDTPLVLLNVAVTVVSLAASYWLYLRRDIPAVS